MTLGTLVAVALVLCFPSSRNFVFTSAGFLLELNVTGLRDYLQAYGGSAWIYTSLLMIGQSLAAPIPALPITIVNALIYGPWLGALISWSSAQAAAMICYFLAQALGRPFVQRLFPKSSLARLDGFFDRYGLMTVLAGRLIPVVSFDLISYAAGLTSLRAWPFFLATGLGQLPAAIVYSFAGAELASSPSRAALYLLWFLGGLVVLGGVGFWWRRRRSCRAGGTQGPS